MRILLCLFFAVFTLYASSTRAGRQSGENAVKQALSPDKLQAIRLIGRNVLQAKTSATQAPSDHDQLNQLRAALDRLIVAEVPVSRVGAIRLSDKFKANSGPQKPTVSLALKAARTRAWDEISKLRQQAGHMHRTKTQPAQTEVYSAGLLVGEQRGRLYDALADKLETILHNDDPDRIMQLRALRDQLKPRHRSVTDTILKPGTPTLQAMPWQASQAPESNSKTRRKTSSGHK